MDQVTQTLLQEISNNLAVIAAVAQKYGQLLDFQLMQAEAIGVDTMKKHLNLAGKFMEQMDDALEAEKPEPWERPWDQEEDNDNN